MCEPRSQAPSPLSGRKSANWGGTRPSIRASVNRGRRRGASGIGLAIPPPHILGQELLNSAEKHRDQVVARKRRATERATVHAEWPGGVRMFHFVLP